MAQLLDTNVVSELRKGERAAPSVRQWYAATRQEDLYLSVLVLGELRQGVERLRGRDWQTADSLERWRLGLAQRFAPRILPVTLEIADRWGRFSPTQPLPLIDALLAATALVHDLTLVTCNVRDVERSGARVFNPFLAQA